MIRSLAKLSTLGLLAVSAAAQCGNFAPAATFIVAGDDTLPATHYALAAPFTMIGSSGSTTWTHFRASTNGWITLTDGLTTVGVPGAASYGSVTANAATSLYGAAGSNPRIAAYWGDLNSTAPNGCSYETSGSVTRIVWSNVVDFGNATQKSIELLLDSATGTVTTTYSPGMNVNGGGTKYVGVSQSNGSAVNARDLSPGPATTVAGGMHQAFTVGTYDLGGRTIQFSQNAGGWNEAVTCVYQSASHTSYGSGCYTISDSAYELFANATAGNAGLTGQSVSFTPAGATYLMQWGGGSFITPGTPVNVFASASDDAEAVVTPSLALPTPQGPQASVRVHSNGLVSWGAAAQTFPGTNNYTPTAAGFLGAANAGIWFWHDYNEAEALSGRIVREEVVVGPDTVLVVTWNGVENYASPEVANPSTTQLQCNLTTGVVTIVFLSIDANASSTFGSAHLVGYSPAGASANGGSLNLATALPLLVSANNVTAMSLSATPAPVSTAGSGTLVTYTQNNIPEAAPASSIYLGATIISIGQDLPGTDLGFIGMPGCSLHITSLDLMLSFVGATNSLTTQFQVPAGVPYGVQLFAQSAALIVPGSLPNGQNAFGATVSNGVASFISTL